LSYGVRLNSSKNLYYRSSEVLLDDPALSTSAGSSLPGRAISSDSNNVSPRRYQKALLSEKALTETLHPHRN